MRFLRLFALILALITLVFCFSGCVNGLEGQQPQAKNTMASSTAVPNLAHSTTPAKSPVPSGPAEKLHSEISGMISSTYQHEGFGIQVELGEKPGKYDVIAKLSNPRFASDYWCGITVFDLNAGLASYMSGTDPTIDKLTVVFVADNQETYTCEVRDMASLSLSLTRISDGEKLEAKSKEQFQDDRWQDAPTSDYKEAAKYPDRYQGTDTQTQGKILEITHGDRETTYRLAASSDYYTIFYIVARKQPDLQVAEGDIVTVYGIHNGLRTYETVLGGEMTIPCIYAADIVLVR